MRFRGNSRDQSVPATVWGVWVFGLIGVGSAVLGLLPWIITGMRLPLQNLWADDAVSDQMPFVLLPFSNYAITLLVGVIAVGAALAGVVCRATARHRPRFGTLAAAVGVLLVQVVASVQTSMVVGDGLRETGSTDLYFYGLVAGTVATIVVGMLMLALLARAPKAGALAGASLAAVALGPWLSGLVYPSTLAPYESVVNESLLRIVQWIPAIVVGLAIVWCGVTTAGRIAAAVFSLVALWVGPALFTAVVSSIGSRALARNPLDMLDYGTQVFQAALLQPGVSLRYVALAAIVAAVGLVTVNLLRRRSARVVHAA